MDSEQGSQVRGIPRLSRLPLPRAGSSATHQDDLVKHSQLPKSSANTSRKISTRPLGESVNVLSKPSNFQIWRATTQSLTQPSTSTKLETSLDTTPPRANPNRAIRGDGDENQVVPQAIDVAPNDTGKTIRERRKPRPSLSERTIETLAQVSPVQSPTRRRSSTISSRGSMAPPVRPPSVIKSSRSNTPTTPSTGRAPSPSKRPFRPPGRPDPQFKDVAPSSSFPAMDNIYTPPRAFFRDRNSRIAKPHHEPKRSISTATDNQPSEEHIKKLSSKTAKVKSMYDLRAAASKQSTKPPLPELAERSTPTTPASKQRPAFRDTSPQTSLLKARRLGENFLAPTSRASVTPSKQPTITKRAAPKDGQTKTAANAETSKTPVKSSLALRDTIAKARAAKRAASSETQGSEGIGDSQWSENDAAPSEPEIQMGTTSFKKKLEVSLMTGVLNLSAMSLKDLPSEVMTMYDFDENSKISWAETVDLVKLLLADNEITELTDAQFPDWSKEDMLADPAKTNQFGGLEVLDLHNNHLTAIPHGFRRLGRLRTLNLSGNSFQTDPFRILSEVATLHELKMSNCALSGALPATIGRLVQLQCLDLQSNQITHLPSSIADLANLQRLLLGGNKIRDLDVTVLKDLLLIELDVSKNMLSATLFEHSAPSKLRILDASYNALSSLSRERLELPDLQSLALHNNKLATLPDMFSCQGLAILTAGENQLTDIPDSFYELKGLRNVDLSGNNIKAIGEGLIGLESLVTLNLAGNPLREKKFLTMTAEDIRADLIRKVSASITPAENALDKPLEPRVEEVATLIMPKQGVLDLSSRSLTCVDLSTLDLSSKIHTIRLSNNDLGEFPVELLSHDSIKNNLRSLDLSHNPSLHPTDYLPTKLDLPVLESLYIVSTGLTTLETLTTMLSAPQLKELNISCHRLAGRIPKLRAWFPSATTLLASDNWFESIDADALSGLEIVDVRNNEIEALPPKIGLLGNHANNTNQPGRLRTFECSGNRFRVPRLVVVERGTEAILKDLRRMLPTNEVPEDWEGEI